MVNGALATLAVLALARGAADEARPRAGEVDPVIKAVDLRFVSLRSSEK